MTPRAPPLRSVMCVDDDPDICGVLRITLETLGGLRVSVCESGSRALRDAATWRPDLILLDVMMPDMDGRAVLRALRAEPRTVTIPVVLVTARGSPDDLEEYLAIGAADVIVKPFDPVMLPGTLRAIWTDLHARR